MEHLLMGFFTHLAGAGLATSATYLYVRQKNMSLNRPELHLYEYPNYFPFDISNDASELYRFSKEKSMEGLKYFSIKKNKNTTASGELIYLMEKYQIEYYLNDEELKLFREFKNLFSEKKDSKEVFDNLLHNYIPLLNGLAVQFEGLQTEFILHNLLDPAHSVVHIVNPITGRKIGDELTNLGFEIMVNYKRNLAHPRILCGYEVRNNSGIFKCTTIPIKDKKLGLIGMICINTDINYFSNLSKNKEKLKVLSNSVKSTYGTLNEVFSKVI